jgi:S1-C subfamily serine protease
MTSKSVLRCSAVLAAGLLPLAFVGSPARGLEVDAKVREAEAKRVKTVQKLEQSVVAVFGRGGRGGGSGVIISEDGYALTNFHVVQPTGPTPQCGLADGLLYDAVVVGIDPVGDVALIKLLPQRPGQKFPFSPMGDSDKVKVGDWSIAAGNPFLLATDFTPTITFGVVSGLQRYQYPAGTILEYTDCIQIDTSINPGNSGGPLFNLDGEVIGINGRGSFEKRGRVNSGVGYAISINQIKNFLGHLKAGYVVDHATLGAQVRDTQEREGANQGHVVAHVVNILEEADVSRRGMAGGDVVISFAGRSTGTTNEFKNVLGIFPRGWRVPMEFRHYDLEKKRNIHKEVLVRLMGATPQEVPPEKPEKPDPNKPPPKKPPMKPAPTAQGPAAKFYEAKPGFANFYFNKEEKKRLLAGFAKHGDFAKASSTWAFEAEGELLMEGNDKFVKNTVTASFDDKISRVKIGQVDYSVEPLRVGESVAAMREPKGSGGLMVALYYWRKLLIEGEKTFNVKCLYGGYEPIYPDGTPKSRFMTEFLDTESGPTAMKWYFTQKDQALVGVECYITKNGDPCELYFSDYKDVNGRKLPHKIEVRYGDRPFGTLTIKSFNLSAASASN